MKQYLDTTNLRGSDAARYLVTFFSGDALTWWRSFCDSKGGVTNVFANHDADDIMIDLEK